MGTENYWTRLAIRRTNRRRFVAGSGVLAAGTAAILAGCGDDDDEGSPTPGGTGTASGTATGTTTGTATASATEQGRRGGTLKNFKTAADSGVDPAIYHINNYEAVNLAFNQPLTYQASKNLFAMDGMVSMEQVDPLTWVWKVREGMTFHNGDPITAEDWAYSVSRVPVLQKERRGHAGVPLFNYIESTTAVDELTVEMKLKRPNGSTPINMARQYFAFVNKKVAEAQPEKDVQTFPEGAGGGPYLIDQSDGSATRLVRNPNYYQHVPADDGFVTDGPYIDAIETRILGDRAAAKAAFTAGDLDVFGALDALERGEFQNNDRISIVEIPNGSNSNFSFDSAKFFDPRARQAIRAAINYDAYKASILAGGDAVFQAPVNIILPAFQSLTQEDLGQYYRFDGNEAKQLWEAAGAPVSQIRILSQATSQAAMSIGDFVAQQIQQVLGVSCEVVGTDPQTWAQRANNAPDKDWELLNTAATAAAGTSGIPEDSHLIWFDPRGGYASLTFNMTPDSSNPTIAEQATRVADLMSAQEIETDAEARKAKLAELQRYILDNAYVSLQMPIQASGYLGFSSKLRDVPANDWLNYYALRRQSMWIDA